jgi:hypothetical protein
MGHFTFFYVDLFKIFGKYIMLNIYSILYSLISSLFIGLHIFSIKYIQINFSYSYFILKLIILSILLWIISRVFLYLSFMYTSTSTFVHTLLMLSILVSMTLDKIILKKPIRNPLLYLGLFLVLCGYSLIIYCGY